MHTSSTQPGKGHGPGASSGPSHRAGGHRGTALALAALLAGWLPPLQAQATPGSDPAFEDAMLAYEHNHWALSFGRLVVLADQGHVEARRIALQMHHHGPRLYGMVFELAPDRRSAWREGPARAPVQVTDARP